MSSSPDTPDSELQESPLVDSQTSDFPTLDSQTAIFSPALESLTSAPSSFSEPYTPMTVDQVQKALNRSRASIYRYANTDPHELNPPIDPKRLNPEPRKTKDEPLLFAPSEVERFAKYILGIRGVTIEVQESPQHTNEKLLQAILDELKAIRQLLSQQK